MTQETKQDSAGTKEVSGATTSKRPRQRAKRATRPKRRASRKPVKAAPAKSVKKAPAKPAPKSRARRKQSTPARRTKVLATADREGLTAKQVQKRFGVKPVTYYSWRKKLGLKGRRGRRLAVPTHLAIDDLSGQVRAGVQARVREVLPVIVHEEVGNYLRALFGEPRVTRRRRGRVPRQK